MSTTHPRVAKVLVTNVQAANTGTSVATIADGDVILFDRAFNEVGAGETTTNSPDNGILYVGLGVAGGGMDISMPIQVDNIKEIRRSPYTEATPYTVTISNIQATNSTEYAVKIIGRDEYGYAPGHSAPRPYHYISDASATAAEIAGGLAAAINRDKAAVVTASVSGNDLVISGKTIAANPIDYFQRVTFDVATPYGFNDTVTRTVNAGSAGQGTGQRVKDMEQATKYDQRILFPVPSETTKAQVSGKYNIITIEHNDMHNGDLQGQYFAPLVTYVCFASTSSSASAKETAFWTKLTSVVESAGVYVSDIVVAP